MHFYPQERVALFIDGANLYATARSLGFDVDYKRLLELFAKECSLVRANGLGDVKVDIAVAQMTEGHGTAARNGGFNGTRCPFQKGWHISNRHGNIVLDGAAFVFLHL